jgi:hypothetical protein
MKQPARARAVLAAPSHLYRVHAGSAPAPTAQAARL